jgi:internalin A
LIEQQLGSDSHCRITIDCRGPRAESLALELCKLIETSNQQFGIRDAQWSGGSLKRNALDRVEPSDLRKVALADGELGEELDPAPRLRLGHERNDSAMEHFVSYAWGDDTPEGKARGQAIEELCEKAKGAGIEIVRDSTHMQVNDRISRFMNRIGSAQRVFVILSKKYLESEFCMYELWSIWKNCQEEPERFLSKIRVYKLPDARISKTVERLQCASYWMEQRKAIDELVHKHGLEIVGGMDLEKYRCMLAFASHTSEMLSLISDVLKASDFDELLKHGFD